MDQELLSPLIPANRLNSLVRLIRKLSYREGDFTLASGKKSSFYVDLKNTTLHPEGAELIGQLAVDALVEAAVRDPDLKIEAVGGLTLGADPLATAISLSAWRRGLVWPAYLVRKEPKGHGTSRYIEGTDNLRPKARVLVLEDVVTTGGSSIKAVELLRDAGYDPVGVLTVVDREEGGEIAIQQLGLKFLRLTTLESVKNA